MDEQPIHFDPEFETFTYGDPTRLKSSLRRLDEGTLLVFYAGLAGWDFHCEPALYIVGYFLVTKAGLAESFSRAELTELFGNNFHVRHPAVFEDQKGRLVLVKGGAGSRLLRKARRISSVGQDRGGGSCTDCRRRCSRCSGFRWPHKYPAQPAAMGGARIRERASEYVRTLR